jgi:hypothetical protein
MKLSNDMWLLTKNILETGCDFSGWGKKLSSAYVGSGITSLLKRKLGINQWAEYFFILKGRDLYYFKEGEEILPYGRIKLKDIASVTQDSEKEKFCFRLIFGGKHKNIYIACSSREIMNDWMLKIKNCISSKEDLEKEFSDWLDNQIKSEKVSRSFFKKFKKTSKISESSSIKSVSDNSAQLSFLLPSSEDSIPSISRWRMEMVNIPNYRLLKTVVGSFFLVVIIVILAEEKLIY